MPQQQALTRRMFDAGSRSTVRHLALAVAGAFTLASCSDHVLTPTAPADATETLSQANDASRHFTVENFANAQGTFCNPEFLDCTLFQQYGIGLVVTNGVAPDYVPTYLEDFGGVEARYYARHGLRPKLPKFKVGGRLEESRLPDGRRRLRISMHTENTFLQLIDPNTPSPNPPSPLTLYGADFLELPGVSPTYPDVIPTLADMESEFDLVLPADFVGLPDMVEMVFAPREGMEIRRWDIRISSQGRLRNPINGLPGGTLVSIQITDHSTDVLTPPAPYIPPRIVITPVREHDSRP